MKSEQKSERRSEMIEWIFAAVSLAAMLGLLGYFLFEALTATSEPATFEMAVVSSYPAGDGTALVVEVSNVGHEAAADVTVQAEAGQDETREITIDYIGPGSSQQVTFSLPGSVTSPEEVAFRVTGFAAP